MVLIFAHGIQAAADTHYVDLNNLSSSAPYTSWTTAASDIQTAIAAASINDLVLVSNGVYRITTPIDISIPLTLGSVNGPAATIIDGGRSTRCLYMSNTNILVDGFTIANGKIVNGHGGGLYLQFPATIQNCIVSNNTASGSTTNIYGGGIYADGGASISNCTICNNSVVGSIRSIGAGGGIYLNKYGVLQSCVFESNDATGGSFVYRSPEDWDDAGPGRGGALYLGNGGLVSDCSFTDNTSTGGIGMYDIWEFGNDYGAASGQGGAVYLKSSGTIQACTFENNRAYGGIPRERGLGGALYINNGGYVASTSFIHNTAKGSRGNVYGIAGTGLGGAIYSEMNGQITNCKVESNTAEGGAGVYCTDGHAYGGGIYLDVMSRVASSTIYSNRAHGLSNGKTSPGDGNAYGGGVYCGSSSYVNNSIVMWNEAFEGGTGTSYGGGVCRVTTTALNATTVGLNSANQGPQVYPVYTYPPYDPNGDHDSDGLPNSWELLYFNYIDQAVANADSDADGYDNSEEYIAGTNPKDASSYFKVAVADESSSGLPFSITWPSVTGRLYNVQWTPSLTTGFLPLANDIAYPQNSFTDLTHEVVNEGFYRVNVRLAE